jgi:HAMP domain-containing protein
MWALFSTRLRTWFLLAVAVPLAGVVARFAGRRLERRHGPTRLSRGLLSAGDLAARRGRRGRQDRKANDSTAVSGTSNRK